MNIKTFKVERWMNDYEEGAVYNLGETCIDSLSLGELLDICGKNSQKFFDELKNTRLTYGHIFGSDDFLKGVSGLYEKMQPKNIVPAHGAIGANNMVITALIEDSDNMVCVMPTYQQHYSIPESIGAEVRILPLKPEQNFLPDLKELENLVDKNTKMITINNPNNPTGSLMNKEYLEKIVKIAKSADAYVLSDEVYRGISEDGSYMHSIVDVYEKGISVGSMSKIFSLAGLRMGWIATKDEAALNKIYERRDYDTISCGVLDDKLASMALDNKEKIFARNREILLRNRRILNEWIRKTEGVSYVKPEAGTTALVYYNKDIPSFELCKKLIKEKGLLFTPGSCFEMEHCVRIGYAFDSELLEKGLNIFGDFLNSLK